MGITLRVKPEALKTKATEVERDIKELEQHFDTIQDIVSRSKGYWVGVAGDRARKEFEDRRDDTTTVIKRFKEHPTDLLVMAGIYDENERSLTSENQSLDTDVIV